MRKLETILTIFFSTVVWSILYCPFAYAYLVYGSSSKTLYIDQPIKADEWKELKRYKIERLALKEGADEKLFESPTTFPNLKQVSFDFENGSFPEGRNRPNLPKSREYFFTQIHVETAGANNVATYLPGLSKHYHQLQSLSICKRSSFSQSELLQLIKFDKLRQLTLCGPVDSGILLANLIPGGLDDLGLSNNDLTEQTAKFPYLPKLRRLRLTKCLLTGQFLRTLHSPNLRRIDLEEVRLAQDSLSGLQGFEKLDQLTLVKTSATREMLDLWTQDLQITQFDKFEVLVKRINR